MTNSITLGDAVDVVRGRPHFAVSDLRSAGVLRLIETIVVNAIDEHLRGTARNVSVTIAPDGEIVVEDDGRGIPVHDEMGRPFTEIALTRFPTLPVLMGVPIESLGGLVGVGLAPVNGLSSRLVLDVFRDGRHRRQCFARGRATGPLDDLGPTSRTGTRIAFVPDATIFEEVGVDTRALARRLHELAFLLPAMTFRCSDGREQVFTEPGGLSALAAYRRHERRPTALHRFVADDTYDAICVEVAADWIDPLSNDPREAGPFVHGFVNFDATPGGGAHVEGLVDGLASALGDALEGTHATGTEDERRTAVARGLSAVVRVRFSEWALAGRDRAPRVANAVEHLVRRHFVRELRRDEALLRRLGASLVSSNESGS